MSAFAVNLPLASKARVASAITYVLYATLLSLFVYWNVVRESGFSLGVFLLQTVPLLAFLPGMIYRAYRSYSWLCFILLFYFIFAVQLVFSSVRETSDFIFLLLTVLLFISAMMTSRWLQRSQKGVN